MELNVATFANDRQLLINNQDLICYSLIRSLRMSSFVSKIQGMSRLVTWTLVSLLPVWYSFIIPRRRSLVPASQIVEYLAASYVQRQFWIDLVERPVLGSSEDKSRFGTRPTLAYSLTSIILYYTTFTARSKIIQLRLTETCLLDVVQTSLDDELRLTSTSTLHCWSDTSR